MKNRILLFILLSVMMAWFLAPIYTDSEEETISLQFVDEAENEISEEEIINQNIESMQCEMAEIESIKDAKEWFITYKSIVVKYSDILDPPETIYDYFDNEELELLFRVVEAEATEGTFIEKANVASVIFNRLEHDEFGDELSDVLVKKQFSSISDGRYLKVDITEDAVLACEYAFEIQDTTNGSLYFEKGTNVHSSYADYLFTDDIGHDFYVEKGE